MPSLTPAIWPTPVLLPVAGMVWLLLLGHVNNYLFNSGPPLVLS
jgi:hypothetical protein